MVIEYYQLVTPSILFLSFVSMFPIALKLVAHANSQHILISQAIQERSRVRCPKRSQQSFARHRAFMHHHLKHSVFSRDLGQMWHLASYCCGTSRCFVSLACRSARPANLRPQRLSCTAVCQNHRMRAAASHQHVR